MILISELSKVEIALFIVSWTDEAFGWYQPYSDPLYANFIKYLIWTFDFFVLQKSGLKEITFIHLKGKDTDLIFFK
jgi:hypothetical protein